MVLVVWSPNHFYFTTGGLFFYYKIFYLPPVELGVFSCLFGAKKQTSFRFLIESSFVFQIILSVQTCMVSKPYSGLRSACVWQQTRHTIIIPASNKEPSTYHFILHPPLLWLIDLPASISFFLLFDKKEKQIRCKQSWYGRNPVNPSTN